VHPATQKQRGVTVCRAVTLPAATVAGRRKIAQIYITKRVKKMCSRNEHSKDVVKYITPQAENLKTLHENAI
jgi:hypothetical protein